MANGHGGPRTPEHPASVSGPGSLSRRTDGGPSQVRSAVPDQSYGVQTQQMNDQQTAPMGAQAPLPPAPPVPSGAQAGVTSPTSPPYGGGDFGGPTTRPNEPVTAGVPIGPGPGPNITPAPVGLTPANGAMTQLLSGLMATDTTGVIGRLLQQASAKGA